MIFLLLIILFLCFTFYSIIEIQERPHSKAQVSRIIRNDFFRNRSAFQKLASFASNVDSYSNNWYFEINDKNKLSYFSETSFDSCTIPLKNFMAKYYKGVDPETSPVNVADFKVPSDLKQLLDTLQLSNFHYMNKGTCNKKNVVFKYKGDVFNPENRTIIFRYFPEGMCKEMIEIVKKSDNKWNWAIYLDKNWIAESIKKSHY